MILSSQEEIDERLADPENLLNVLGIKPPEIKHINIRDFRHTGSKGKKVPKELRPVIAAISKVEGSTETAKLFNIAVPTANNLQHGRSSNGILDRVLEKDTHKILGTVKELAADRLLAAIGLLDDDRLSSVSKATELSAIAANLSRVVEKVTPKNDQSQGPVFHVYAPELKSLDKYEVIDVTSTPGSLRSPEK